MHNFRGGTLREVRILFFFVDDADNGQIFFDSTLTGFATTCYAYMAGVTFTMEQ